MSQKNPMYAFDPRKLAHYEKENYVAYYQRRWLRLMRVSVGMVKESYKQSLLQAIYGSYLIARAEIAFAPYPDNDIPLAQAYLRRFFSFIRKVHHLDLNAEQAAGLEMNWWVVHRQLFGQTENEPLVQALAKIYSLVYGLEESKVYEAAFHRAQGMLYSDLWVNGGQEADSPLLIEEEQELYRGYMALSTTLGT